jgi:hypothetical protein
MPANENALSTSIKLKKVKKYDVKAINFGLKFWYSGELSIINYQ